MGCRRVARHDSRYLEAAQTVHVTAAQHTRTGELCAFNELVVGPGDTGATFQEDTLVLAEHRGHRLGMLVKCEGLLSWRRIAPASPRVITYNAEENRPMLDINEAIGFVATSYEGAWQKRLGEDVVEIGRLTRTGGGVVTDGADSAGSSGRSDS